MIRTNGTRVARYRNAIVSAAIAVVVLCGGRASAWAASKGTPTPPAAVDTSTPQGSSTRGTAPSMADRYAQRETSARDLEQFKGGDIVIVGSTGVIIVLLVVIIVLLL